MIKVQYRSKRCNPLYLKVKHSKLTETHFYRLYFISTGSKSLLALSQKYAKLFCSCCQCFTSNLLFYWPGYAISVQFFFEENVNLVDAITDKWV